MFVEQKELWVDTRFDRKLAQQARAEAVNRSDHCAVEGAFVIKPAPTLVAGRDAQHVIEIRAQALAHFISGAVGECDGDDLIDSEAVFAEDMQVAFDQDRRFTRAGSGRDGDMFTYFVSGCGLFRQQHAWLVHFLCSIRSRSYRHTAP